MGFALIINNYKYDAPNVPTRCGSEYDVKELKNIFFLLEFRIKVLSDPTVGDIQRCMLSLLSEKTLPEALCLVVVIMTHGHRNDIVWAKDKPYCINKEIMQSLAFQTLSHLPKFVITQTCKTESTTNTPETLLRDRPNPPHNIENWFRFDSTFENFPAIRYCDGSPFIKSLCKQLIFYGINRRFQFIADKVIEDIKRNCSHRTEKQCPTKTYSTIFKDVCFGMSVRKESP